MLMHPSYSINPYTFRARTGAAEHKFSDSFRRKETEITDRLDAYFRSHLIISGIFILFGMPLLILAGVALSATLFTLLFYGAALL